MRAVIQRVNSASVKVKQEVISEISQGFLLLIGVEEADTFEDADYLARKISGLRVFSDDEEKMNLSIKDVNGSILSVSQFTLHAQTKKGNRPSFTQAAAPEKAEELYEYFNQLLRDAGISVQTGKFGEMMDVALVNDGPVTILIDSKIK